MAFKTLPKQNLVIIIHIFTAWICCYSGYGEDIPEQMVERASICFNDKIIYSGCAEAYRLNPNGIINVPPEATDFFCNGPCIADTQLALNCIDNVMENFLFYNKASVRNVRNALHVGCSYTRQRGNFNPRWFMQGQTSNSHSLTKSWIHFCALVFIICCFSTLMARVLRPA